MRNVKTLGLLGTGVIGGGWAARALHFGIDVIAADVKPEMEEWIRGAVANAEPALARLTFAPLAAQGHAFVHHGSQGDGAARGFHPGEHSGAIALEAAHAGRGQPVRGAGRDHRVEHVGSDADRSAARHGCAGALLRRASVQSGVPAAVGRARRRREDGAGAPSRRRRSSSPTSACTRCTCGARCRDI